MEFKLLKKQEELLQLQKEAFKAAYYPKLSLSASYSYLGQGERFPIGAGLGKGVYWSDFSAISLNLQIPIFNGFAIKSKVNQADIELRTIEQEIANSKLGLDRSEEHTSELQSRGHLVCRLLLEKKNNNI